MVRKYARKRARSTVPRSNLTYVKNAGRTDRMVVPGYTRRSGYYGRYNRASGDELKFKDETFASLATTTGVTILQPFTGIESGTGESNRIGRKISASTYHIKGQAILPTSTDGPVDRLRIIVVLDKQANGAAATLTDYLETTDINGFRRLENVGRFRSLHDKIITLNSTGGNGTNYSGVIRDVKINIKIPVPVEYNGTAGLIAEIKSNNILVFIISEKGKARLEGATRFRFRG